MILVAEKHLARILNISDRRVRELFKSEKLSSGEYPLIKCVQDFIAQTRSGDINFVSLKTLSEILSLSEKTVKTLTTKGTLERTPEGKYDLKENLKNYLSVKDEGNKKKAVEREMQEVKLQILKDQYHSDDDVRYILTDMLIKFKAKLLSTAMKIDTEINDIKPKERLGFLKNILIEALEELSEYSPPSNQEK
ncbi:MAG: hypothetical protein CR959_01685 [Fusobacteriales bacterium]|nr:MAG: hypothetical protein CR959_01685 [Fusobacteriales bacterium]